MSWSSAGGSFSEAKADDDRDRKLDHVRREIAAMIYPVSSRGNGAERPERPETNGELHGPPAMLFDVELERMFVAALIVDPGRHDLVSVAMTDLADFAARAAFVALVNLRARGAAITVETVRAELAQTQEAKSPSRPGEPVDLRWFNVIADIVDVIDSDVPIQGWAFSIIDYAARRAAAIEDAEVALRQAAEYKAIADREEAPAPIGRTWDDCVAEIYIRKDEPWIDLRVGAAVIATCRNGSFVPLIAPSASGKSSLVIQMLIDHAIHRGPSIYLTYELDGDEAVARAVGQLCSFSWVSVLHGEVPRAMIPSVARLRVLESEDATLVNLARVVAEMRVLHPDQPVLVIVDYMQAAPAPPGKERGFAANVSVDLRRAAKKNRVVLIGVSQASTENSKKLRAGELLGIEGASSGAETAQIERDGYVILTLAERRVVDPDSVSWKLSTAKYRFGVADVVQELYYHGRTGAWEPIGPPVSGADARDAHATGKDTKKREELRRSIVALVDMSPVAMSKAKIEDQSTGRGTLIHAVIKELVRDGLLVHVDRAGKGGAKQLWTARHIEVVSPQEDPT